jgi:hypothetical protein
MKEELFKLEALLSLKQEHNLSSLFFLFKPFQHAIAIAMKIIFSLILMIGSVFGLDAENLSTRSFYSNFLFAEKAPAGSHLNFEGFVDNTLKHLKDPKSVDIRYTQTLPQYSMQEVHSLVGKIHNTMLDTFYTCARTAPKAEKFYDAVNGTNTPDSHHYASLLHSALGIRGIKTDFIKTPYHYGIHYTDPNTGEEMFWCIITPLSMKTPPKNIKSYVNVFNKYRNKDLNPSPIKESQVEIISVDNFADMNMPNRYRF